MKVLVCGGRDFYHWGLLHNTLVHGHIHQNPSPPGPYKCVCVEQINYTPIHIEDLKV